MVGGCGFVEELLREEDLRKLGSVADLIYREFLVGDSPSFSVVDKLASAVSPRVAEMGLYEVLRVVERRAPDVEDVVRRVLRGLGIPECVEVSLEVCRRVAMLALAKRVTVRRKEKEGGEEQG